jgi:hypothetical protein
VCVCMCVCMYGDVCGEMDIGVCVYVREKGGWTCVCMRVCDRKGG